MTGTVCPKLCSQGPADSPGPNTAHTMSSSGTLPTTHPVLPTLKEQANVAMGWHYLLTDGNYLYHINYL